MTDHETVDALKASDEYQRLGVIGRQKLLWETFPELREKWRRETEAHMTGRFTPPAIYRPGREKPPSSGGFSDGP
jgi:hypothetical protein